MFTKKVLSVQVSGEKGKVREKCKKKHTHTNTKHSWSTCLSNCGAFMDHADSARMTYHD